MQCNTGCNQTKFFHSLVRHAVLSAMVLNPHLTIFDVHFP
jgi:hypothetical protein